MITPRHRELATKIMQTARGYRSDHPRETIVRPMMALINPKTWPVNNPEPTTQERVVVGTMEAILSNPEKLTEFKKVLEVVEPEAVIFWSEGYTLSGEGPIVDMKSIPNDQKDEALVLMIQTKDDFEYWSQKFEYNENQVEFKELTVIDKGDFSGRLTNWYPTKPQGRVH